MEEDYTLDDIDELRNEILEKLKLLNECTNKIYRHYSNIYNVDRLKRN